MKKALLAGLAIAVMLAGVAIALPYLRARLFTPEPAIEAVPPPPVVPSSPPPAMTPEPPAEDKTVRLKAVGKSGLDAQIRRVVESMDRDGRPPRGIAQGGGRAGRRGTFENAGRRLPVKAQGYYRETDVWPPGRKGRGADRLVLGREGEVYYSANRNRTFTRIR